MSTKCIEVSLEDNPMRVLQGCTALLSGLNDDFVELNNSNIAIVLIADLLSDAVSRLEDEQQKERLKR